MNLPTAPDRRDERAIPKLGKDCLSRTGLPMGEKRMRSRMKHSRRRAKGALLDLNRARQVYLGLLILCALVSVAWLISNRVSAQGVDWGPGGSEADYERAVKGESTDRVSN